jgi:RNase P subunit RPR2
MISFPLGTVDLPQVSNVVGNGENVRVVEAWSFVAPYVYWCCQRCGWFESFSISQLQYESPSKRVKSRRTGKWVYLRWNCKVCKSSKLDLVYFDVIRIESGSSY